MGKDNLINNQARKVDKSNVVKTLCFTQFFCQEIFTDFIKTFYCLYKNQQATENKEI